MLESYQLWEKRYSSELSIDHYFQLYIKLGFDMTDTKKLGRKYLTSSGGISWTQYDPNDIKKKVVWKGGGDKFFPERISNTDIIKNHIKSGFSRKKTRKKKFKHLPDEEKVYINRVENTFGVSRHPHTHVFCFDIDVHPLSSLFLEEEKRKAEKSYKILLSILGNPLYAEISMTGGMHLYYSFDRYVTEKNIKDFITIINDDYNISIEVPSSHTILQLPDSGFYKPIYFDNNNIQEYASQLEYYNEVIDNSQSIPLFILQQYMFNQEEKPVLMYNNRYKTKKTEEQSTTDLFYGKGERVEKWYKKGYLFAYAKKMRNPDDQNEFESIVCSFDKGSKDMQCNPDKYLKEAWKFIQDNPQDSSRSIVTVTKQERNVQPFISNKDYLSSTELKLCSNLAKEQIKELDYKREKLRREAEFMITQTYIEIIGRIKFEEKTQFKRRISTSIPLTKKMKNKLETGYIFYRGKLIQHLKLKYPAYTVDIHKIVTHVFTNNQILDISGRAMNLPTISIQTRYKFKEKYSLKTLVNNIVLELKKNTNTVKDLYTYLKETIILCTDSTTPEYQEYLRFLTREEYFLESG